METSHMPVVVALCWGGQNPVKFGVCKGFWWLRPDFPMLSSQCCLAWNLVFKYSLGCKPRLLQTQPASRVLGLKACTPTPRFFSDPPWVVTSRVKGLVLQTEQTGVPNLIFILFFDKEIYLVVHPISLRIFNLVTWVFLIFRFTFLFYVYFTWTYAMYLPSGLRGQKRVLDS